MNAQINAAEGYLITLIFHPNNLDKPASSIARTFIYELIDAEIFQKAFIHITTSKHKFEPYLSLLETKISNKADLKNIYL